MAIYMAWANIELKGMEEFHEKIEKMMEIYPDFSIKTAEALGSAFSRENKKTVKGLMPGHSKGGYKRLTSGHHRDRAKGYGKDVTVAWHGQGRKNQDWHLVEKGHQIIRPNKNRFGKPYKDAGANLGYVPGINSVNKTLKNFEEPMKKQIQRELKKAQKKVGLD
jgi:hypothetical protein